MIYKFFRYNKIVLFTLTGFLIEWVLYYLFGHRIISAMYEERGIGFLNNIIEGQTMHSLEHYILFADKLFLIGNIVALLVLCYGWLLSSWFKKIKSEDSKYSEFYLWSDVKKYIFGNKRKILTCLFIFVLFYLLYSSISFRLAETSAFSRNNLLFEIDTKRAIGDITSFSFNHYRTKVHPIYVLLVNPLGSFVTKIFHNRIITAIILNSFVSTFNVVLAFLFFYLFSKDYINSLFFSFIFGFSMSQFILGVVPDTSSLATFSLFLTYFLFFLGVVKRKQNLIFWCIAGILSLGITVTNFIQTLICFIIASFILKGKRYILQRTVLYISMVLGITGLLSIIQKLIYPSTQLFFLPDAYKEEINYINFLIINNPIRTLIELIKHFFVVNFIAPIPHIFNIPAVTQPAITFVNSWNYLPIGYIGLFLGIVLWIKNFLRNAFVNNKTFLMGIISCIFFNLSLHTFYGINEIGKMELFLYTGNFTFLTLIFLSWFIISNKLLSIRLLLFILTIAMVSNNLLVMKYILEIYT